MIKIDLAGTWRLTSAFLEQPINGRVPGSVYFDLLQAGMIPDPFVGDNEYAVREVMRHDFTYMRTFMINASELHHPEIVFEGIDTVSEIRINHQLLAQTCNMHRRYRFDLRDFLVEGENEIEVVLRSPIAYIEERTAFFNRRFYHAGDAMRGFIYLRKASSMFGWDWGPQLPDAGIWRDIYIEDHRFARIDDVRVKQTHSSEEVVLDIWVDSEVIHPDSTGMISLELEDPSVKSIGSYAQALKNHNHFQVLISEPQLWWPVGYGDQPLYTVRLSLHFDGLPESEKTMRIGLRTIEIRQDVDPWGKSFAIHVNQVPVFAKGANYIIEDNLLARQTYDTTRDLLTAAASANHNTLRVWGGGIYPPDYFYDLCDELGILVWQDLMFSCAVYELSDAFVSEIEHEVTDNLQRIRHHACLALICGNNENEVAVTSWHVPNEKLSQELYLRQYEQLIPLWVQKASPELFYWPSSPSSGGGLDEPNSEERGDMHYWGVWHNNEPITGYRNVNPRFMSEFGIQSFPCIETVSYFAQPEDLNIFSYVMECHQKNQTANDKILQYIGKLFRYPKDFPSLLYVSQLIQAEGVRYGVEHWRRQYGRTMGTLYWQLNDCWPVASWSAIDYFHRKKALFYHSRKFFASLMISIEEKDSEAGIWIVNDRLSDTEGVLRWELMDFSGHVMEHGTMSAMAKKQSATLITKRTFSLSQVEKWDRVLRVIYRTCTSEQVENQVSFAPDKHLRLIRPDIKTRLIQQGESRYECQLESAHFAKYVVISFSVDGVSYSDNYFHLFPNEKRTIEIWSMNALQEAEMEIQSLFDTYV